MLGMRGAIVVGFDGREASRRALERGIGDAKASGGALVVVIVAEAPVDPNMAPSFSLGAPPPVAPVSEEFVQPRAVKELADQAVEHAQREGVSAEVVWDAGDPMRAIVDAARDREASAIVVGSHHYNLLQRLMGEDVAAAIRRRVDCDVIAVE